jgi:hypothetical protein
MRLRTEVRHDTLGYPCTDSRGVPFAQKHSGRSGAVAWFRRRGGSVRSSLDRANVRADLDYLEEFVRSRYGVEAFLEPRTTVTENTVILIAHDGEWTRRRVPDPQVARQFAARVGIPVYDVHLVGYPQRMRDYNERRKKAESSGA